MHWFFLNTHIVVAAVTARPRISLHPGPLIVKEGDNVTLPSCHVTGYPTPTVTWRRVSASVSRGRTSVNGSSLMIRSAQKDDTDTYFCQASNLLGSTSATTFLVVVRLPRFTHKPPAKIVTFTGKTMTLNCSAEGDPQPVISWRREGGQLPRDRTVMTDGSLTIKDLRKEDAGVYVCVATSAAVFHVETPAYVQIIRKYILLATVAIDNCCCCCCCCYQIVGASFLLLISIRKGLF